MPPAHNGAPAPEIKDAAVLLRAAGEQFGQNLPENVPMVVHAWTTQAFSFAAVGDRPARDGIQINLDLSKVGEGVEDALDYHCFSAVLLRQLTSIGKNNLPIVATFVRRETQDGRKDERGNRFAAWSIKVD